MRIKFVLLLFLLIVPINKYSYADTDINNAEAIFIYNFLSHIQWPEETLGDKYLIGVIGKSATYDYLVKLTSNRKIGNRSIQVMQYNFSGQAINCQVIILSDHKSDEIFELNEKLKGKSCLTVGEKSGLTESGAIIDFNVIDGKLRYRINEENAKKQKLLISSTLLRMSL